MTRETETNLPQRQRDPDLVNAEIAIKRATKKARENARKSGVSVVIIQDGKIIEDRESSLNRPG